MSSTFQYSQELTSWSSVSWKTKEAYPQRVNYLDSLGMERACARIGRLPALVSQARIDELKDHFAAAANGSAFILVGGDCAENFDDVQEDIIRDKYRLLQDQAAKIESVLQVPVHTIGRIAGQYAKPRSQLMETLETGEVVHSFRGHNVNGIGIQERAPDPERLVQGYLYAAATVNCLSVISKLEGREIWTSHEALHLELETSQTKQGYNTSAGFLWLGERTNQPNNAHVEYLRGLENPLGVKVGPTATPESVLAVLKRLCPQGVANVERVLPPLVEAVRKSPYRVVWMSDPCHGNTISANGIKTRCVATMLEEVQRIIDVLCLHGLALGGLHLEQTGEDIHECVAGTTEEGLQLTAGDKYRTLCDPRLSGEQARRLVHDVAELLKERGPRLEQKQTGWRDWLSLNWNTETRYPDL
ncbi:class II DAHP synthetase family protein [Penicillium longicatenatum]|uniref:class II DAHP synthetase family protein n=1 Tax=Penicillium longicatenatum TaxID=1561947 RepID=UPI002547EF3C|nr:class II DAHP synthetase family protein [Penicillium longicatenatum]KAJ5660838.1 class II DAHP synthetase family protein [Penicillium longicatenatum]